MVCKLKSLETKNFPTSKSAGITAMGIVLRYKCLHYLCLELCFKLPDLLHMHWLPILSLRAMITTVSEADLEFCQGDLGL